MKGEELPGFQEDGEYSERAFESWLREQAILPAQVPACFHDAITHSICPADLALLWRMRQVAVTVRVLQLPVSWRRRVALSLGICRQADKPGMQDEPAPSKAVPHPKSPEIAPAPTEVCQNLITASYFLPSDTHTVRPFAQAWGFPPKLLQFAVLSSKCRLLRFIACGIKHHELP